VADGILGAAQPGELRIQDRHGLEGGLLRWGREPVLRQLTANPTESWVMSAAIPPNSKDLAFVDRIGSFVRSIDSGETHPIAVPPEWIGRLTGLSWFPDRGKLIGSVRTAMDQLCDTAEEI